jgi:hypothetical protein
VTLVLDKEAVRTRVPLWLVVVRGTGAWYVEVLTGGDGGPQAFAVSEDKRATLRTVRQELARYLTASSLPVTRELRDDVLLCANEVLTNALVHTASRVITVTADVLRPDARRPVTVQVVVADEERRRRPSSGRLVGDASEHGRGLRILDELATWGCRPRTHGKELWFRCSCPTSEAGGA